MYAQVAIDVPLFTALTYAVPQSLREGIKAGQLVQVPFRNRAKTGLLLQVDETIQDEKLDASKVRELLDIVDAEPLLTTQGIEFLKFVADYYLSPIGEVVKLAIPSSVRLEGVKCYTLAQGIDAPPQGMEDDLAEVVSMLLKEPERETPLAISTIKARMPKMTFVRLMELETAGIVAVSYEEETKVKAKMERYYRVVHPRTDVDRVGKKQQQLLDLFLTKDTELGWEEIKEQVPNPGSSLKTLVERGILTVEQREVYRDPFAMDEVAPAPNFELTLTQMRAVEQVRAWRQKGEYRGFVLHGVTGSGKTETYVRIIKETLEAGRQGLILLPEIALTPQFVSVFRSHFGDRIAVLHSGLTPAEKFDQWRRIKRNEVDIVIGARSAIFAPLDSVGVIIVDEEHDQSFKQQEGTRYNARDMAMVRGKFERAQVVLGSATPSLESFFNAKEGRLTYLAMPERVSARPMPEVELIDMRAGAALADSPSHIISSDLVEAIWQTKQTSMQSILFLNRRGYSPCILCDHCGHVWMCPHCDVSLTYHRHQEALRCHYCDYSLRMPESCPTCGQLGPSGKGVGTQKLEEHLSAIFRGMDIARLDRDTSGGKKLRDIIKRFRKGDIDLMVGTQMVTKGHDFPKVTTVGVVLADLSLNFPDFRASERTFQLLTQVAGRAGRGEVPGKVYIQTYSPEHYSLESAQHHDFEGFARKELEVRQETAYPPFGHLVAFKFEAASEGGAHQAARDYAGAARRHLRQNPEMARHVFMLGPALAPLARLKGKYRWQILIKSRSRSMVRKLTIAALNGVGYFDKGGSTHKNVRVIVDVDPLSML